MNLILTRGGVLMMKAIIIALILVLVGLPVMAEENETVAECSGVNCFDSLFSVESDTGTAPTINMYTLQHSFVLNPETGEITLDGKPIEKLSHEEIRDSLKIIAQEMIKAEGGRGIGSGIEGCCVKEVSVGRGNLCRQERNN